MGDEKLDINDCLHLLLARTEKIDKIEAKLNDLLCLKTNIDKNTSDIAVLRSDSDRCYDRLLKLEQRSRQNNIEIVGFPYTEGENAANIFVNICKVINAQLNMSDLIVAHRVPTRNKGKNGNIICALRDVVIKSSVLAAYKLYRKEKKSNLSARSVNSHLSDVDIYLNEHLTVENKALLAETRKMAKDLGWKYVWVEKCTILTRKDSTSKVLRISYSTDIKKMK